MSVEDAIDRADLYLETADLLLDEGDYASSISGLLCNVLRRSGVAEAGREHAAYAQWTSKSVRAHFVKEGPLSERFAQMLNDAEEMRALAKYGEGFVVNEEDAFTTLKDANEFVERGSELLRSS